jgi:hypothetical protein
MFGAGAAAGFAPAAMLAATTGVALGIGDPSPGVF